VSTVEQFLAQTRPATWNLEQWRQLLRTGRGIVPVPTRIRDAAGERNAT
jgi:hypothetical protein